MLKNTYAYTEYKQTKREFNAEHHNNKVSKNTMDYFDDKL
jgi:hypothetical protein